MMNREGVGMMEVIIGMLILTVGILAMAAATTFVQVQLWSADMRTERQVARQQIVEELQTLHFDSIQTVAEADAVTRGEYILWWDATSLDWALKEVDIIARGPAVRNGERENTFQDTMTFRIARLIQ
ncbi:MAG: hypothetical protein R3314_06605 [Longimicrobiales bacterium]|nr:hypothetical protein [Longimicrobiales bacterium]